ncbi:MAG: helix-turn-helix domain-containing protein [Limisphaerales bacterium]
MENTTVHMDYYFDVISDKSVSNNHAIATPGVISFAFGKGLQVWSRTRMTPLMSNNSARQGARRRSNLQKGRGFAGERIVVLPQATVEAAKHNNILKLLFPTSMGYFPKAAEHLRARESGAAQTIFIYCVRGCGWVVAGGRRRDIKRDQLLILPANVPHAYGANKEEPWSVFWFHAIGSSVPSYLEAFGISSSNPLVSLAGDIQLTAHFEEALKALERGFSLSQLLYAAHALTHLLGLMLWNKDQFQQRQATVHERVEKTIEFMRNHLEEPLTVGSLATIAGLSASRYSVVFRKNTGHSPIEYLIRLRMQRAVHLLGTTSLPVKTISNKVGWEDPLYFSRLFRSIHGFSPAHYRLRHETLVPQE